MEWQKQTYPLIKAGIYKDNIIEFWKDKPVRFAYMNNCIGCFHRNEVLLNLMSKMYPEKFNWFIKQEQNSYTDKTQTFKNGITYERIRQYQFQQEFAFDDFTNAILVIADFRPARILFTIATNNIYTHEKPFKTL